MLHCVQLTTLLADAVRGARCAVCGVQYSGDREALCAFYAAYSESEIEHIEPAILLVLCNSWAESGLVLLCA